MNDHYPVDLHDPDAELAVLWACLNSHKMRQEVRRILLPSDFYSPSHEAIYDAMHALDRAGRPVDVVTLNDMLLSRGEAERTKAAVLEVATHQTAILDAAPEHAAIVHRWGLRRRLAALGRGLTQRALSPSEVPERLASQAVTMLAGVRDGSTGEVTAVTLAELMDHPDDDPTWVIPGLLETGDRLMLTGSEGAGKSALSRQLAIMAAAGVHPFTEQMIPPVRALIIDAENKATQIRRQTRPLVNWLHQNGADNPMERVMIEAIYPRRINLLSDQDLGAIHQLIDGFQPQIVVIGPIYRMSPRALQTDDEAHPFLAALDTITERGCALIVEAHAGHSQEGAGKAQARSLRPRGSSALLGWPEFGLGLRGLNGGVAELEPWRGHREARSWPTRMRRAAGNRWVETYPDDRGYDPSPGLIRPPEPAPVEEPQSAFDMAWEAAR